jgi:putative protease
MEVDMPANTAEVHVMTTRFCLRREMGACLKTADADKLPKTLFLRPIKEGVRTMRLQFDCANCQMKIYALQN